MHDQDVTFYIQEVLGHLQSEEKKNILLRDEVQSLKREIDLLQQGQSNNKQLTKDYQNEVLIRKNCQGDIDMLRGEIWTNSNNSNVEISKLRKEIDDLKYQNQCNIREISQKNE